MKLQLLIPQYNETDEVIKPLLDSIAIQQGIDFSEIEVIICNDGSDIKLTDKLLNSYPFKIHYYLEPHRGVSGTRNACLDYSTADYVMFCDADDMFLSACGLYIIFREIQEGGFDTMSSCFVEEVYDPETDKRDYIPHEHDPVFVHGKIHNRKFLIDNNLRWKEELTLNEDSYFNCLCNQIATHKKYCGTAFYLWKYRAASVGRCVDHFGYRTQKELLDSGTALINDLLIRDRTGAAQLFVISMVYDSYFALHCQEWLHGDGKQFLERNEKRFAQYYHDFHGLFESAPKNLKIRIANQRKKVAFPNNNDIFDMDDFNEWLEDMKAINFND